MRRLKALFFISIIIFLFIIPESINAQTVQTNEIKVSSIVKSNYLGKITIGILASSDTHLNLRDDLQITTSDGKPIDYQIAGWTNSVYEINITNPKLGKMYTIHLPEEYNIPLDIRSNMFFSWNISKNSYVNQVVFPKRPMVDNQFAFSFAIDGIDEKGALLGISPNLISIKAYKHGINEEAVGELALIKIETALYPFNLYAKYDKAEIIDIGIIVDGVELAKRVPIGLSDLGDYEDNKYPQWWNQRYSHLISSDERSSATVMWGPASDLFGIKEYHVKVNDEIQMSVSADVYDAISTVTGDVYQYSAKLVGLNLGTEYRISIEAENILGFTSKKTENPNFEIITPGADGQIIGVSQIGNVLGEFILNVYGASDDDIYKGLKVFHENDGVKKYATYKIESSSLNSAFIMLDNAQVQKNYKLEIGEPLTYREGIKKDLLWNLSSEKSKVYGLTSSTTAKINDEFTFVVFLDDGGEGHSVINVKKDNFNLVPLLQGTNEKASGTLTLKKVSIGENLDNDGSVSTEELGTYYVTASYSKAETIDIQVAIDGVTLNEKLKTVKIESKVVSAPNFGGGGFVSPSNTEETKTGVLLKGTTISEQDLKTAFDILQKNNQQQILINATGSVSMPLLPLLNGKHLNEDIYIEFESQIGKVKLAIRDIDEKWLEDNLKSDAKNAVLYVELQNPIIPLNTNVLGASISTKLFVKVKDKSLSVEWPVTPQFVFDKDLSDVIVVTTAKNGEWKYVPASITHIEKKTVVESKFPINKPLYILENTISFADTTGHWAEAPIIWLSSRYIINGYNTKEFRPEQQITRAEFSSMLLRSLGLDEEEFVDVKGFNDVDSYSWYANAIFNLSKRGIVNGFEDGNFYPNNTITREEMAAMIERTLSFKGQNTQPSSVTQVEDSKDISSWATSAVQFLYNQNIVQGRENNEFAPRENATRGETAAILMRMIKMLEI